MFDKTYKQLQEGWKIVENRLEGGLSDNMTLSDIAKKHVGNSSSKAYTMAFYLLKNELKKGIKVEMEHTNDSEIAKGIAKDHLYEDPDYYTKLEKCQIDESEEKTIHKVCYMVTLDKESQNKLHELSKQFDIKADEIVPKDEYHATIRFMKTNKDLEPFKDWLHSQELPTISVEGVKLDKMNDAFVIKLEGEGIQEWFDKVNEWLVENGYPKSDYDTFKPHISFSYQTHEDFEIPKWNDKIELKFDKHEITTKPSDQKEDVYKSVFKKVIKESNEIDKSLQEEIRYGEYWIDDSGNAQYCDVDIVDVSHEGMIKEQLMNEYVNKFDIDYENNPKDNMSDYESEIKSFLIEMEIIKTKQDDELYDEDPAEFTWIKWLKNNVENVEKAADALGIIWNLKDGELNDARDYGMKWEGWKRLAGNAIQTWTLSSNDLKIIGDGIYDAYGQGNEPENLNGEEFTIEVMKPKQRMVFWNVPWEVIDSNDVSQLLLYKDR